MQIRVVAIQVFRPKYKKRSKMPANICKLAKSLRSVLPFCRPPVLLPNMQTYFVNSSTDCLLAFSFVVALLTETLCYVAFYIDMKRHSQRNRSKILDLVLRLDSIMFRM